MITKPFFFFFNDTATTEIYTLSLHDALPISREQAGRPRLSQDQVRSLRGVTGDACARGERARGVGEPAAGPVLRAAPRPRPRAGVTGDAVLSRAVRRVIERRGLIRRADPARGRRRPLALVARQAARRCRAAGEVELASSPRGEGSAHMTGRALAGRGRVIELHAGGQRRVRGGQQRRSRVRVTIEAGGRLRADRGVELFGRRPADG